jgi:hypothetical protein
MLRKLRMIHRKLLKSWYQPLLETLQMISTMRSFKMLREKTFSKMIRMFKTTLIRMFRRMQIRKFRELGRKEEG